VHVFVPTYEPQQLVECFDRWSLDLRLPYVLHTVFLLTWCATHCCYIEISVLTEPVEEEKNQDALVFVQLNLTLRINTIGIKLRQPNPGRVTLLYFLLLWFLFLFLLFRVSESWVV
jgi:hypothetical protein